MVKVSRVTLIAAAAAGVSLLAVPAIARAATPSFIKVAQTNSWDVYTTPSWYSANSGLLGPLLPYLDAFVARIATDFGYTIFPLPAGQPRLVLVLDPKSHGAGTGTFITPYGVTLAADSIGGVVGGVKDFWFYILALHETINVWTGSLAVGWPWADGSPLWAGTSPFPGAVDVIITAELGLGSVSTLQESMHSSDLGFDLFLNVQRTYGWPVFQKLFGYVHRFGITNWTTYPEPLRTAIIAWFLSFASGVDLLGSFNAAVFADSGQTIPSSAYSQAQAMFPLP